MEPRAADQALDGLRAEMRTYFDTMRAEGLDRNERFQQLKAELWDTLDRYADEHPDCPAVLLKARTHEEVAERFEPVVFPHCPFYFEMGLHAAESWGIGSITDWVLARHSSFLDSSRLQKLRACSTHAPGNAPRLWNAHGAFDIDHHCLGYTKLLRVGVNGILEEIAQRRRTASSDQHAFLDAADRSCRAVLRLAERFAERAEHLLAAESDPEAQRFLSMIASTARRVPAAPPGTFYEGLAALLFLREVTASMEAIGVSVVGHPDRHLIDLYREDLRTGHLTEPEARDLLARWMLHTDVRFHLDDNSWPETSTCIELGGCDETGAPIFNELTRLIIETHRDYGLVNPKLNCRYAGNSPDEYLALMGETLLDGHSCFAFLNDDALIPALVRSGKSEREARLYVNGGCQETIVEGLEHSAPAYFYFNMPRVLDLCLQPVGEPETGGLPAEYFADLPGVIDGAADFETFYRAAVDSLRCTIALGADLMRGSGERWSEVLPCPFLSSSLEGCIEEAADYTTGAARYNPGGITLVGLGTVVDSLCALRAAVFEEKWLTLEELRQVLASNWEGHEALRARMIALPKYGHGDTRADELAGRLARDLGRFVPTLRNERGGPFQPSFFVYYQFVPMGHIVRATPDGRYDGDPLNQGISPGRVRPSTNVSDVFRSLRAIDFADFPGNAVVDRQLPLGTLQPQHVVSLLRTFALAGGMTLQLNCVSVAQLEDAQEHPERHRDLVVRISGLSAKFVALRRDVQDEIISRTLMEAGR